MIRGFYDGLDNNYYVNLILIIAKSKTVPTSKRLPPDRATRDSAREPSFVFARPHNRN